MKTLSLICVKQNLWNNHHQEQALVSVKYLQATYLGD